MRYALFLLPLMLVACNPANVYERHYRVYGELHPELQAKQHAECRSFGYADDSAQMADCRRRLAQDWKRNFEWRPTNSAANNRQADCGYTLFGLPMSCPQRKTR